MEKTFTENTFGRPIIIDVDVHDNIINFYLNQKDHWIYDIPINEWNNKYPFWQDQMNGKAWFTDEMKTFINSNTKNIQS